jgi:hypothetical protein
LVERCHKHRHTPTLAEYHDSSLGAPERNFHFF